MIYKKPRDITYTDMCIYIDNNVYKEKFDETLVFQYLYFIIKMLSSNEGYFSTTKHYEDFAIYGAIEIFKRLTRPNQYIVNDDGTVVDKRIKSVLNYIKKTLLFMKCDFLRSEIFNDDLVKKDDDYEYHAFNNLLYKSVDSTSNVDFTVTLEDIASTCKKVLSTIPVKKYSSEWSNIYVSVMLTLLKNITLSRPRKHYVSICKTENKSEITEKEYLVNSRLIEVQLFHLPKTMSNYILVLSRIVKHTLAKDLAGILSTRVHSDFMLDDYTRVTYGGEITSDDR